MTISWNYIYKWGVKKLQRQWTPLPVKALAWRLVTWLSNARQSDPISFLLRPVFTHKWLRTAVGVNLVLLLIGSAVFGPVPSLADNTGGKFEITVVQPGEVNIKTEIAVRVPVAMYRITQGFWFFHPGLDFGSPTGEPIRPVMAGKVTKVEKSWFAYGNHVIVTHDNGYTSLYGHMSKILAKEGDEVTTDSIIGEVGSTGHSTGPHLHLEIAQEGKPLDPKPILAIK